MPTTGLGSSRLRATLRAVLLAVVVLVSAACSGEDPDASPTSSPQPDAVRMAVVGDSITDADSPDLPGGNVGQESWVYYALGPQVSFAGGSAVCCASTEQMADQVP